MCSSAWQALWEEREGKARCQRVGRPMRQLDEPDGRHLQRSMAVERSPILIGTGLYRHKPYTLDSAVSRVDGTHYQGTHCNQLGRFCGRAVRAIG